MIDPKTVQQIRQASVAERLHIIEQILQSLRQDMNMHSATGKPPAGLFTIRQFSLGQEVHVDREQLYAERSV